MYKYESFAYLMRVRAIIEFAPSLRGCLLKRLRGITARVIRATFLPDGTKRVTA